MKELEDDIRWFKGLSLWNRLKIVYFALSLFLVLGIGEYTPLWVMISVVLNFGVSALLVIKSFPDQED